MVKRRKKQQPLAGPFYEKMIEPAPVDVFRACVVVYQSAAALTMPVKNPGEYKIGFAGKVYAFTDNPMNRGMMAIKEFLRGGEGTDQSELMPAVTTRIMAIGGMTKLRADPRFQQFFKEDQADGSHMVSDALIDAFAVSPFKTGTLDLDMDAVLLKATELFDADDESQM